MKMGRHTVVLLLLVIVSASLAEAAVWDFFKWGPKRSLLQEDTRVPTPDPKVDLTNLDLQPFQVDNQQITDRLQAQQFADAANQQTTRLPAVTTPPETTTPDTTTPQEADTLAPLPIDMPYPDETDPQNSPPQDTPLTQGTPFDYPQPQAMPADVTFAPQPTSTSPMGGGFWYPRQEFQYPEAPHDGAFMTSSQVADVIPGYYPVYDPETGVWHWVVQYNFPPAYKFRPGGAFFQNQFQGGAFPQFQGNGNGRKVGQTRGNGN